MPNRPRILFCGPSQSGKDTAALMLCEEIPGLQYAGSMSRVIAPRVAEILGLTTDEAYARRHEDRELWFRVGNEMREENPVALLTEGFARGDVLTGARNKQEIEESYIQGIVTAYVWVDRPDVDDDSDPTLEYRFDDLPQSRRYMLVNAGTLDDLRQEVSVLARSPRLGVAA